MHQHKSYGIRRLILASGYSLAGLRSALRLDTAFRQETVLFAAGLVITSLLHITGVERALLIGSLFLVLIVELLNTAVECAIDRISHEIHPLSKRAKDLGSAAVFLALANAAFIWASIVL